MNLVTIIIPAYNAASYIDQTIESVKRQTHTNWELLVIDDGSTDATSGTVGKFLGDGRIKYFHQKNSGVSAARNLGIEKAKGDFISFLDADDVWVETNLEIKLEALKDSSLDFVFASMMVFEGELQNGKMGPPGTDIDMLTKLLLWEGEVIPCPSGNLLIRKKCFYGGLRFDTALSTAADQDFTIYLCRDFIGKYIERPLVYYRVVPGSMSKNIKVMEKDHLYVLQKAVELHLMDDFIFRLRCFSNLFMILAGSYWKDAGNKVKGSVFLFHSIIWFPPNGIKLIRKYFS